MNSCTRLIVLLALALLLLGCKDSVSPAVRAAEQFNRELDKAILELQTHADNWEAIIRGLTNQIPATISKTVREDLSILASRAASAGGRTLQCQTDFFAARGLRGLQIIRARLDPAYQMPVPNPKICEVSPPSISLASTEQERDVYLSGYDLSATRTQLRVLLINSSGEARPADGLLVVNSDYQATLTLRELQAVEKAVNVKTRQVRIETTNGVFLAAVVVNRPGPATNVIPVILGRKTIYPTNTHGDNELATRGGPTKATASARLELRNNNTELWLVTSMWVKEQQGDGTEASKTTEEPVHRCAERTHISRIIKGSNWDSGEKTVTHFEVPTVDNPTANLVKHAEMYIDHDRDDIGAYTRTEFIFNPVEIETIQTPE